MNFLVFLLMVPVSIVTKTFPLALALAANHFPVPFNYIAFTVTSDADHFYPPERQRLQNNRKSPFTGRRTMQRFYLVGNKKIQ
jgi:hypothetical protein